jgi:PAS domain S-box-containing protein
MRQRPRPDPPGQAWLLDASDAAVIAVDPDGKIFYWNAAVERLYGYSSAQLSGACANDLLVAPGGREHAAELRHRLRLGHSLTHTFRVWCAGGRPLAVRVSDSPLWDEGRFAGIIGVHIPVDEALSMHRQGADQETRRGGHSAFGWDSLTDGELRVVRLVAQGLTNRESASRLHLSQHTVDSHLKSVYTKLDIRSRVQLTRAVFRHDS